MALEESGWVQTHPNPPVASPLSAMAWDGRYHSQHAGQVLHQYLCQSIFRAVTSINVFIILSVLRARFYQ